MLSALRTTTDVPSPRNDDDAGMADDDDELEPVQEPEDGDSYLEQPDGADFIEFNGDNAPASTEIVYAEYDDIHSPHGEADPTAADDHGVSGEYPE